MSNTNTIVRQRTRAASAKPAATPDRARKRQQKAAAAPIDPATLPKTYALAVVGDCMEPAVRHGTRALFSTTERFGAGDIVCLWFTPAGAAKMGARCALKRLRTALPPWVKSFPYKDNPASNVEAAVTFESDNPRRTYCVRCSDIAAIHKFTGCE